jgi:hypothetical protein
MLECTWNRLWRGALAAAPIAALSLLCTFSPAAAGPTGPAGVAAGGEFEWTSFAPSYDTKIYYVSSSTGNDNNSGLSESKPLKTLEKAQSLLRHGYPDWMLLKRGDVWTTGLGQWKKSGRSEAEPMLVSSYGASKTRPLLTGGQAMIVNGGAGTPSSINNLAIVGLSFWASKRDPLSPEYVGPDAGSEGISWVHPGTNILIEDCVLASFTGGISLTGMNGPIKNFKVRGSLVVDSYAIKGKSHSSGIYATNVKGLLIEGCVFDHNGWNEYVPGAVKTMFNHNMYIDDESNFGFTENVTVRNNIIARGSSHGLQLRPGGLAEGNLFVGNALGMFAARGATTVRNNIVIEPTDITINDPRGWGIEILQSPNALVEDNITLHQTTCAGKGPAFNLGQSDDFFIPYYSVTLRRNIVSNWKGASLTVATNKVNKLVLDKNDFPGYGSNITPKYFDPSRSLVTYQKSLGGTPTTLGFIYKARLTSKATWNSKYSAAAAIAHISTGFNKGSGSRLPR